ncbi:hypothetical protein sscle_05g048140 [Sclerotinia sclerotiorum 1980 UF-70]|uniref:F-box domain-containing protein n=1 Tax=Sclerotinia sclerotiorum (strain ATCC 18683 / 1980 / Ss-1) TaxID=665079 RepID=A0A1D9Q518_SCLS1|nr:hypothetical protein sscle_05g048140 [Sclerotinia sclerotiorum 1980 UF-70]
MSQPPTLLTLPPEIRRKILHYAIYFPRIIPYLPNAILVSRLPRVSKSPYADMIPSDKHTRFYGTNKMSSIFVVCRLFHAELEEIFFTRFIFSFPHHMRLATVQEFTTTISPRACTLLREIMAIIHFDLRRDEYPLQQQEALIYLKKKLPGLKKVHLGVGFVAEPLDGVLVKRRRDGFANIIFEFVISFASGIEVVVTNSDSWQCRKDIMQTFNEKVEEPMGSSKMKTVDYDIKVLSEQ